MSTRVAGVELPNPVMTASGTSGYGAELGAYFDLSALGAVVVKSLSAEPWAGNPAPRLLPAAAGMLNSVGLHNAGVNAWAACHLPALDRAGARVVVSVWARTPAGYGDVGRRLASALAGGQASDGPGRGWGPRLGEEPGRRGPGGQASDGPGRGVVAVEANISCPNIEDGERMFAHCPKATAEAVGALVRALEGTGLPVWAKLSPNAANLTDVAGAALGAGAVGLTLVNTLAAMALDPLSGQPRLGGGGGGLSGPALHPVAVRAIYECRRSFPEAGIVGVGGVSGGYEAAEMLAAGANAVQVGTATFRDPRAPVRVAAELERWCAANGVAAVRDLVGKAFR
jgi:dihydroorotate dehydrogenase (NAD+) catalytic subunit